jgi:predicted alpha/beta-hydrolase family hydrolase
MSKTILTLLTLFVCRISFAATVETKQIRTPRGVAVNVAIDLPDPVMGKRAAVIIAPGQGYHMDLPILKELGAKLAASGVIAFRFNWNYLSADPQKRGTPSDDLSNEMEDMQAVVDLAKADLRVDSSQIIIAGKSMGSVVAYSVFSNNPTAKAVVLLTPLCSSTSDENGKALPTPRPIGALNYPRLTELGRPIVLALGNADPACFVPVLYDWLKTSKGNVWTVVVGGNHSWEVAAPSDDLSRRRNTENISESVRIVAHWINLILAR